MPALVLTDLSHLRITAEISETDLKFIDLEKEVDITIPSLAYATKGKIVSIIPSSNPMTHKFRIKIDFDTKNEPVYPGMYAKVVIKSDWTPNAVK